MSIRLIVGLGNPGEEYALTRHNLGFLVIQRLVQQENLVLSKCPMSQALSCSMKIAEQPVYLLMPATYMNKSGVAVKAVAVKKEINPENILIVCDEVYLDFGQMKLKPEGGHGGHNGLKSIIAFLGTQNFPRLRLGVGPAPAVDRLKDYVLENFSSQEKKRLPDFVQQAADCCQQWIKQGIEQTMNQFNKRKDNEKC